MNPAHDAVVRIIHHISLALLALLTVWLLNAAIVDADAGVAAGDHATLVVDAALPGGRE